MLRIALFNWPYYVAAFVAIAISVSASILVTGLAPRLLWAAIFLGAAWFVFGSLGVAHLVYDRSALYRFRWLERALPGAGRRRFIMCHCGFDDASTHLREQVHDVDWLTLDHYRPEQMTEASIRRARRHFPPNLDTVPATHDAWPVEAASADAVIAFLAIHELRSESERSSWFREARRCLRGGGRVVLVEHVRDFANFLAFGPGFLHFHSRGSWRRAWEGAELLALDEFRVTPWVRVFVLGAR
jgi:SAM-dependent methyltransferase